MIAKNKTTEQACQKLLSAFFEKYPNANLQIEANRVLKCFSDFQLLKHGKPGGWAGGVIYALTNQYHRACGVPCILNKECEEFFDVSMGTIYKRTAMIKKLLLAM